MKKLTVLMSITTISILILHSQLLRAQSDTLSFFSTSGDIGIFSRYIWRGQEYGHSPSIQPSLSVTRQDFTLGAWGAYKFSGAGDQETDLYLSKSFRHLTFEIWDYWSFCDTTVMDFFNYNSRSTSHLLEAQVMLTGNEKLPFNLIGSYFFYGNDPSKSIYVELQYMHSSGSTDMLFFIGIQPKGDYYGPSAGIVNIGSSITENISVTDTWVIPLNLSLILNPMTKSLYLVAGMTL